MSGISSVSDSNTNPYLWLLQNSSQTDPTAAALAAAGSAQTPATAALGTTTASAGNNANDLLAEILSAVSSAIQNAEKTGNTSDLKTVVRDAVNQTLKQNGYDPQDLKNQSAANENEGTSVQQAHHHHRHHGGGGQGIAANGANDTNSDSSQDSNSSQIDSQTTDLLTQLLSPQTSNQQGQTGYLFDQMQ